MKITRRRIAFFVLFALSLSQSPLVARGAEADRFFIIGYVTSPGSYTIAPEGTTVGGAIDLAGGFSAGRHVSGVEIVRLVDGQKQTFDVKLSDSVLPDDTIRVR